MIYLFSSTDVEYYTYIQNERALKGYLKSNRHHATGKTPSPNIASPKNLNFVNPQGEELTTKT